MIGTIAGTVALLLCIVLFVDTINQRAKAHRLLLERDAAGEKLAASQAQLELCDRERMEAYELLKESRKARREATARAELAERVVTGQSSHIASLQKSNDSLVEAMMEMRRIGYGILSDALDKDLQDGVRTVTEEDEITVEAAPDEHRRSDE